MIYTLFLDDERFPTYDIRNALIARNVDEAVTAVTMLGLPERISFDHDLGDNQPTAMEFMWWLIESHLDERFDLNCIKEILIHSANPVGAQNLKGLWDGFATNELTAGVFAQLRPR